MKYTAERICYFPQRHYLQNINIIHQKQIKWMSNVLFFKLITVWNIWQDSLFILFWFEDQLVCLKRDTFLINLISFAFGLDKGRKHSTNHTWLCICLCFWYRTSLYANPQTFRLQLLTCITWYTVKQPY